MERNESIVVNTKIRESNKYVTNAVQDRVHGRLQESIRSAFGVDLTDKKTFDFANPFFSWKGFREAAYKLAAVKTQEANAENTFGQLLRAGINNIANNWYNLVDTNHELIGATTYSTHAIELHAPLQRGGVPRRVNKGGQFPQTRVVGRDIQIVNEKFGAVSSFERELFDDDQTGQIAQRAQDIGANMRIIEDAWFFQRFIGTAGSYAGDVIPASQTYPSGPFTTAQGNTGASFVAFTPANLQLADLALMNMVDLLGNKLMVNPNTLLVGTSNKFSAATLLNSEWYPSTASLKIGGGSGTDSTVGTTYAKNPMQGLYNLVVSRFFPQKGWAIGEAGKGIVFQRRDALEVIQENPMSGMAFTNDVFNFRSRARWEPDWIDPLFWYLGNDGSV